VTRTPQHDSPGGVLTVVGAARPISTSHTRLANTPTAMTIGAPSRRTGVPIKLLHEYEDAGLIYTVGRSPRQLLEGTTPPACQVDHARFQSPRPSQDGMGFPPVLV